jgi:hypothetical protein
MQCVTARCCLRPCTPYHRLNTQQAADRYQHLQHLHQHGSHPLLKPRTSPGAQPNTPTAPLLASLALALQVATRDTRPGVPARRSRREVQKWA